MAKNSTIKTDAPDDPNADGRLTPEQRQAQESAEANTVKPAENIEKVTENPEFLGFDKDISMVLCMVPKEFTLTLDNHRKIKFTQGLKYVPEPLVEHWYAKAHGLERSPEPKKPALKE